MTIEKAADAFLETELDGELVLLNLQNGSFHAIKDTGLAIWRLIDGQRDAVAIQQEIASRYNVDDETCRTKVNQFLKTLADAGFVKDA
ncbi:PqqD family protein [Gymnodinialimonas sp.]